MKTPPWFGDVQLGMKLWFVYSVSGVMGTIPLYSLAFALWPGVPIRDTAPALEIVVFLLAGTAVVPGLVLGILRRRLRYVVAALVVPMAATVVTLGLIAGDASNGRGEGRLLATHALPQLWVGTLFAMAMAYDKVRRGPARKETPTDFS